MTTPHPATTAKASASLLWDHQDAIPLNKNLGDEDLVLLLTPAVIPNNPYSLETSDPFEPLGQALARVHPWIRHVPYTKDRGITGVHVAFIKRAKTVLFVLTTTSSSEGVFQLDLADAVRKVCEDRRLLIVVACCALPADQDLQELGLSTLLTSPGFTAPDLESMASVLMGEQTTQPAPAQTPPSSFASQPVWTLQTWDYERDLPEVHMLWLASLPQNFHLDCTALGSLLKRDGYAMHHIVRDPQSGSIVGFCATYTTFADSSGDRLVGSIAVMLVRDDFRGRGIGRFLHDESMSKLSKIRGVGHLQIGSTFPRLLYGLPSPTSNIKWFENRGWRLDESGPGRGRPVADWLLRFADHPIPSLASAGLTFKPCQLVDTHKVIEMASRESERKLCFGWYDQYARTADSIHMEDIIVGFEGDNLIAAAITYSPNSGGPCGTDVRWSAAVGEGIGGVSCICIKDDDPDMVNGRSSVTTRLLNSCRQSLTERGMVGMFVDAVRSDDSVFTSLGFHKWAEYKEAWRKV